MKCNYVVFILAVLFGGEACPPGEGNIVGEESLNEPAEVEEPACKIGMNNGDLDNNQPLFFHPGTYERIFPIRNENIIVDIGASIDLYCSSSFASPLSGAKVIAKCVDGDIFSVNGVELRIRDIKCTTAVARATRKTDKTCYDNSVVAEIGFDLKNQFIPIIEVCFNEEKSVTYYTHYSMYPGSDHFQTAVPRPSFIKGGFYRSIDIDGMYTQASQQQTFARILGPGSDQYFDTPANLYLARGHLAAKAEFIFAPPQIATFYFINVAPQWQTFNAGNWARIEDGVRRFATERKLNLDVYTGEWGISTLPDSNGVQKELYLSVTSNGKGYCPIPRLFYKVIIDKASKLGIVLIGVNNPFSTLEEIQTNDIICNDVSDRINWINWERTDINRGYSYACDVNEFIDVVGEELPALTVSGLLY